MEAGFLLVFIYTVSGGQALLLGLSSGSGFVHSPFLPWGYPVMDYAIYTLVTAMVVFIGILALLSLQRNPNPRSVRALLPCLVLMVFAMLWIIRAEGGA